MDLGFKDGGAEVRVTEGDDMHACSSAIGTFFQILVDLLQITLNSER